MLHNTKKIDYNDEQMQVFQEGVVSCGYHSGLRMKFDKLTNEEYAEAFTKVPVTERDSIVVGYCNQLLSH